MVGGYGWFGNGFEAPFSLKRMGLFVFFGFRSKGVKRFDGFNGNHSGEEVFDFIRKPDVGVFRRSELIGSVSFIIWP